MKVRYISSPKQDAFLAPSEYRRYTNHIIVFNIVLFSAVFFSLTYLFFNKYLGVDFIKQFKLFLNNDYEYMKINSVLFQFTIIFFFIPSSIISYYLTNKFTKAANRQVITAGNIVDNSNEVLINLSNSFKNTNKSDKAFLSKGDIDYNLSKPRKIKNTIFLPESVTELSTLIIGEAGSGKTVLNDRIVKQVIDNKHKLIIHNVKGDELDKLSGYCNLYLIEPWNKKNGYAIDFLNLVSSEELENENARIRTFVMAFTEGTNKKDFFDTGAISVIDSFVRSVVRTTKDKGIVKGTLGDIVKAWNSFNIQPIDTKLIENDNNDFNKLKAEIDKNKGQLDEINKFITKYNPTASIYINAENAKTSLCVLASCIEIIRKFETLSSFWGDKEKTKSLNIRKWIHSKKDRQAIVLSNSNKYADIANSYIGAFINLIVPELIDNSYKPSSQINFILDEFPQLSSIDLDTFMKLPDVGRSKNIRVTIIIQRTSQIKEKFSSNGKPADSKSFAASFQNKVICRFATDDNEYVKELLGEQDIIEYTTTSNFTAQGQTFSNKATEKKQPAFNISELHSLLGPQTINNKFVGVRILFKYSQFKVMPLSIMPPVKFDKKFNTNSIKSISSAGNSKSVNKNNSTLEEDKQQEVITTTNEIILEENIETTHIEPLTADIETNPLEGAIKEVIAHSIDTTGALATINLAGDIIENLTTESKNNNITEISEIKSLLTKKKNNKELEK